MTSYPDTAQIPARNKAKLRAKGLSFCEERLAACHWKAWVKSGGTFNFNHWFSSAFGGEIWVKDCVFLESPGDLLKFQVRFTNWFSEGWWGILVLPTSQLPPVIFDPNGFLGAVASSYIRQMALSGFKHVLISLFWGKIRAKFTILLVQIMFKGPETSHSFRMTLLGGGVLSLDLRDHGWDVLSQLMSSRWATKVIRFLEIKDGPSSVGTQKHIHLVEPAVYQSDLFIKEKSIPTKKKNDFKRKEYVPISSTSIQKKHQVKSGGGFVFQKTPSVPKIFSPVVFEGNLPTTIPWRRRGFLWVICCWSWHLAPFYIQSSRPFIDMAMVVPWRKMPKRGTNEDESRESRNWAFACIWCWQLA